MHFLRTKYVVLFFADLTFKCVLYFNIRDILRELFDALAINSLCDEVNIRRY